MINRDHTVIFIMGTSGTGKSTIGKLLAEELSIPFFDGDDFHSKEHILKMASGASLNDDDRFGWLTRLNNLAKSQLNTNSCIIACSALKEKYRELLSQGIEKNVKWVFLNGTIDQVQERLKNREHHFMPITLLKSQFDILEVPNYALQIDIALSPEEIVHLIKEEFLNKAALPSITGTAASGPMLPRPKTAVPSETIATVLPFIVYSYILSLSL